MSSKRRSLSTWQLKWASIGSAMVLAALVSAPLPAAAVTCDLAASVGGGTANLSPSAGAGWDVGSGQCNGDFTVLRDATFPGTPGGSGMELGMRIEQRSAGQLNPPAHTQRDYTVQLGADPNASNRAWWNFQQSIAYDGVIDDLDALTFIIRTDAGTSVPSAPSFDMLAVRAIIDDRNTNGTATYSDLYQTSQNPVFGYFSAYDFNEEGAWTLTLVAMKDGRVSSVSICVHTPAAACDPAPASPITPALADFRDKRRGAEINVGSDLREGPPAVPHFPAINFTGVAGAADDTWVTVYDPTPGVPTPPTIFTGSVSLSADVLIAKQSNAKGAGLVALYNQPNHPAAKGLALFLIENGNSDRLVLATVTGTPTPPVAASAPTTLMTKTLAPGQLLINKWYRVTMDVVVTDGSFSVTGKVFNHADALDPNSAVTTQVGGSLVLPSTTLVSKGLADSGEVGIVATAKSATVNSSVTNFVIDF